MEGGGRIAFYGEGAEGGQLEPARRDQRGIAAPAHGRASGECVGDWAPSATTIVATRTPCRRCGMQGERDNVAGHRSAQRVQDLRMGAACPGPAHGGGGWGA